MDGKLVILLILLLFQSCSSHVNQNYGQTLSSWRWAKARELTAVWGSPQRQANLPNGNKVYIYEKELYRAYPTQTAIPSYGHVIAPHGTAALSQPQTTPQPSMSASFLESCTTIFEIDPRNIIVDVRAQGTSCTADTNFANSKTNPKARMYD